MPIDPRQLGIRRLGGGPIAVQSPQVSPPSLPNGVGLTAAPTRQFRESVPAAGDVFATGGADLSGGPLDTGIASEADAAGFLEGGWQGVLQGALIGGLTLGPAGVLPGAFTQGILGASRRGALGTLDDMLSGLIDAFSTPGTIGLTNPGVVGDMAFAGPPGQVSGIAGAEFSANPDSFSDMVGTSADGTGGTSTGGWASAAGQASAAAAGAATGGAGQESGVSGVGSAPAGGAEGGSAGGAVDSGGVSDSSSGGFSGGGGAGGGDGGKMICAELYRQGLLPREIFLADERHAERIAPAVIAGYHLWARPLVRKMRQSRRFSRLVGRITWPAALELAKRGDYGQGSRIGAAMLAVGQPMCVVLAFLVSHKGVPRWLKNHSACK